MRRLRSVAVLLVLALLMGLPWAMLQTVAWTRMLAEYSRTMPMRQALAQTFDGRHPCALCLAIRHARQSERSTPLAASGVTVKLECDVPTVDRWQFEAGDRPRPRTQVLPLPSRTDAPPKPRPRYCGVA